MSKTINDLREHLFAAMDGLAKGTMDIDKAKAISDLGQTIINTAKVEVEHMKITGGTSSGFIQEETKTTPGRFVHRIKG